MSHITNKRNFLFIGLIFLGIALRYAVMCIGNNFDFDSYCIVGEISGNFRNVYAETTRYNYAPIFFFIQGLMYRISQVSPDNWHIIYRILIVAVLTLADLGITFFILKRYSTSKALLFFLNPVSIIITGYHNQFDNIAVLFALLSIPYFNYEEKFNKRDIGFIIFFSLSLITKHILFLIPVFILFIGRLPLKKKIIYACVPPSLFLFSFIPFALSSEAFNGILNNVFLYRSTNNSPLLAYLFDFIGIPLNSRIIFYFAFMIITAWVIRRLEYEKVILIYLIAMVTFTSAIVNQYLVIPMVALCVMNTKIWNKIYIIEVGVYLILQTDGLGMISFVKEHFSGTIIETLSVHYAGGGCVIAVWILLFTLIHLYKISRKGEPIIIHYNTQNKVGEPQ